MVATIGEAEWALLVLGKLREARNRRAVIAMFAGIAAAAVTGIALSAIAVAASALPALSLSTLCAVSASSLAAASRLAATAGLSAATTSTAALGDRTRRSRRGARNRDRALGNAGDRGRARNRGCVADIAAAAERDIVAGDIVGVGDKARASSLDLRLVGSQGIAGVAVQNALQSRAQRSQYRR
jgi:hypothetical protein